MMTRFVSVLVCLTLAGSVVEAAPQGVIPPPKLVEGQFVYTIPEGYYPDGLSKMQVEQLNGELKNLHFPFYVVILENLPQLLQNHMEYARLNGFTGDGDTRRIEVTTARLIEDWAALEPAYNVGNTSVFVISFNPRKYAWNPGTSWIHDLGLDKRAQDPYTAHFIRAAKMKPADYGRGIANLARNLDEYVFDQTDPVRIAQRKEYLRRREEARRLQAAQGALDTEIMHLSQLLAEDKSYLPADVDSYTQTLTKARTVRAENDPAKMLAEAETMKGTVEVLAEYVENAISEARTKFWLAFLKWAAIAFSLFLTLFLLFRRRSQQNALTEQFMERLRGWEKRLSNAETMWTDHYMERDGIIGLEGTTGKTKALWDETTRMVDEIHLRIQAMRQHLADCKAEFAKGHYLNFEPLTDAYERLNTSFSFDTKQANTTDLFGAETILTRVVPEAFAEDTKKMFAKSIEGWKRLLKAVDERLGEVSEDLPHTNLDTMFRQAQENNISTQWFNSHPLFGDDASDAAYYEKLAALRDSDPISYMEAVEAARKDENNLMSVMDRLCKARQHVAASRVESPFDTSGTKVDPSDDPAVSIARARQAEDVLEGLFQTASVSVAGVEKQADEVIRLYRKVATQGAEIDAAIRGVQSALSATTARATLARTTLQTTTKLVEGARRIFSRIAPAEGDLAAADGFMRKGEQRMNDARRLIMDAKHLDARRALDEADSAFGKVNRECDEAKAHVTALEHEKAAFEHRSRDMANRLAGYGAKMRNYSGFTRNLDGVRHPVLNTSTPQDYAALMRTYDTQELAWQAAVREASAAFEAEQARRRRAEAAARAAREAEERRRRASYSSSSSSSGSGFGDFGGGGFSGSSGGFGGGGFSGSSGSF